MESKKIIGIAVNFTGCTLISLGKGGGRTSHGLCTDLNAYWKEYLAEDLIENEPELFE